YKINIGDNIEVGDVRKKSPRGFCDVLIAGPPCQGFSTLGKKDHSDPRNLLCLEVVRFAKILKPKIIVIENVAAFVHSPICHTLASRLSRLNYKIDAHIFDAFEFGIPQKRVRSFTIASQYRLSTISAYSKSGITSVRKAWEGLSIKPDGKNHHYSPNPSALAL